MKKITLLVAFIGMIMLQSCVKEEQPVPVDKDTIAEVFEYSNVDFHPGNAFSMVLDFPHAIYTSDMVLVYRLSGSGSAGDVWKLMPETYYFNDGTLDFGYTNDFTRYDAKVNLVGFDLPALANSLKLNQVIRIVVIPAAFGNKTSKNDNYSDYNATIKKFGIIDSEIKKIRL